MAKKRVHEIAKEQGLTSKELLAKLNAAGIEAKAAASSVEESVALEVLGNGASAAAKPATDTEPAAADKPKAVETRSSRDVALTLVRVCCAGTSILSAWFAIIQLLECRCEGTRP